MPLGSYENPSGAVFVYDRPSIEKGYSLFWSYEKNAHTVGRNVAYVDGHAALLGPENDANKSGEGLTATYWGLKGADLKDEILEVW